MAHLWLAGGGPYDTREEDHLAYQDKGKDVVLFEGAQRTPFAVYVRETGIFHDSPRHGRCAVFDYAPVVESPRRPLRPGDDAGPRRPRTARFLSDGG